MKRIVILKGSLIDSLEEFVLLECLGIMFPECEIEIRADPRVKTPDNVMHSKRDQNQVVL